MNEAGRVAIVTGSATGVGAAAAIQLARLGIFLVINYTRSAAEAKQTAEACRAAGSRAIVVQVDVGSEGASELLTSSAIDEWGRIDYLVNNAARTKFVPYRQLERLSSSDFHDIYQTNVVAAYNLARAVAPFMKRQGRGAIVNTSSIGGITGIASSMAYAASKGALNLMTRSLALALGPEIRVNAVAPGVIQGRWLRGGLGDEQYASLLKVAAAAAPLKRVPTSDEVAEAIVWFLTGATVVTGTTLLVDAGIHCGQLPEQYDLAYEEGHRPG